MWEYIAAIIITAAIGYVWWSVAYWYNYSAPQHFQGIVSSYTNSTDIFNYTSYNLEYYGGAKVNWTAPFRHQLFWASLFGTDINASPGEYCSVAFKGAFMTEHLCTRNQTK
jgi:hypothetical protein